MSGKDLISSTPIQYLPLPKFHEPPKFGHYWMTPIFIVEIIAWEAQGNFLDLQI